MDRNYFLPILLFLYILNFHYVQSQRSSFGEPCGKDRRCDRRAWLGCFNEKCDCLKPEEMIYEPSSKKCVSKAGERCKFPVENLDGNTALEITTCVDNSRCGPDGFCSCKEDFMEISNGTCIPSRKLNEPCDEQFKCSSKQALDCKENVCECGKTRIFSSALHQCVGLVGQECVRNKCAENSACDLRSNQCHCIDGHFQNSENKCTPKLGLFKNCTEDNQCGDKAPLKCLEGVCTCDPDVSQLQKGPKIEDEFPHAICVGKVNSPCVFSRCVGGASCHADYVPNRVKPKSSNYPPKKIHPRDGLSWWTTRADDDYGILHAESSEEADSHPQPLHTFFPVGHTLITTFHAKIPALQNVCLCNEGYTHSAKAGTCGKPFGASCTKEECVDGLVCKGNHCTCRYPHQEFCTLTLTCRNKIRGPCNVKGDCIEDAVCSFYRNQTYGECKCKEGYVENMKRECDVQYGGDCVRNSDCDSVAGLICMEGHCECRGFAKFSEQKRKCLGLVGNDCIEGVGIASCVDNASCISIAGGTGLSVNNATSGPGTCVCNDGFSISPGYTCEGNEIEK